MKSSSNNGEGAFALLLSTLSSDNETAHALYEELRRSLIRYFSFRGLHDSDLVADEVIDRVVVKFGDGAVIDNVQRYSFGVARLILLEKFRKQRLEREGLVELGKTNGSNVDSDELLESLRQCMTELTENEQALLMNYYSSRSKDLEKREQLAREHGTTINGLRLKVFRLKKRLEGCVNKKRIN